MDAEDIIVLSLQVEIEDEDQLRTLSMVTSLLAMTVQMFRTYSALNSFGR